MFHLSFFSIILIIIVKLLEIFIIINGFEIFYVIYMGLILS